MTPSPSFPVENPGKDFDDKLKEHIRKITTPIFEKALKEKLPDRMSVGRGRLDDEKVVFYQPHNLRLYFDWEPVDFDRVARVETDLLGSVVTTEKNYGSEISFKNFLGCEITVKRKTVEVRDYRAHKRWYAVHCASAEDEIVTILADKTSDVINILKEFIRCFGGKSGFNLLNIYSEDKVAGEDAIDLIPLKQKFQTKIVKKVYNERNVEFKSPAFSSHYLEERAKEDFVANKLEIIRGEFQEALDSFRSEALVPLTEQIKLHLKVQEESLLTQRATQEALRSLSGGVSELKGVVVGIRDDESRGGFVLRRRRSFLDGLSWEPILK